MTLACLFLMNSLIAEPIRWPSVAENTYPAVAFIASETNSFDQAYGTDPWYLYEYLRPFYEYFWPTQFFSGTGFIISPDGYIVTNQHVIDHGTRTFVILRYPELKVYPAKVVGRDTRLDLAVLKIENEGSEFPYLQFGNSDHIKSGEEVIAIGNPLGLECTVTKGIISSPERNNCGIDLIEGYIQTDTALNFGNSGGPLLNHLGEVVGMNTWSFRLFFEGLNFAIPSNAVKSLAHQLITNGEISQGFLGIEMKLDQEEVFSRYYFDLHEGAMVTRVIDNSPAHFEGIEYGDLILEMNGAPVRSPQSLRNKIAVLAPGTDVHLTIERYGKILELTIKLGSDTLSKKHSRLSSFGNHLVI